MTGLVLLLLFLVVPFLELWFILTVADSIGTPETILVLILVAVAGTWLMKRAGLGVLRRLQEKTERGELPTDDLVDGALVLGAGALLLTPGFLTDIVGLVLLLPPTRALLRPGVKRWAQRKVETKVRVFGTTAGFSPGRPPGGRGDYIDADAWEDEPGRGGGDPGPPRLTP